MVTLWHLEITMEKPVGVDVRHALNNLPEEVHRLNVLTMSQLAVDHYQRGLKLNKHDNKREEKYTCKHNSHDHV